MTFSGIVLFCDCRTELVDSLMLHAERFCLWMWRATNRIKSGLINSRTFIAIMVMSQIRIINANARSDHHLFVAFLGFSALELKLELNLKDCYSFGANLVSLQNWTRSKGRGDHFLVWPKKIKKKSDRNIPTKNPPPNIRPCWEKAKLDNCRLLIIRA